MKVLVTGSSGFLGRAVVDRLDSEGHDVWLFDLTLGYDIRSAGQVRSRIQGMDAVIHLAGVLGTDELFDNVHGAIDVNLHGGVNVIEAVHENEVPVLVMIDQPHIWHNPYEATKGALVRIARGFAAQGNFRLSVAVTYNAFGPGPGGHPSKIIPKFCTAAWAGEPLTVYGDGSAKVDLVFYEDVAIELVRRIYNDEAPDREAATGVPFSVLEVARMINKMVHDLGGPDGTISTGTSSRRGETSPGGAVARNPGYIFRDEDLRYVVESYRPEE